MTEEEFNEKEMNEEIEKHSPKYKEKCVRIADVQALAFLMDEVDGAGYINIGVNKEKLSPTEALVLIKVLIDQLQREAKAILEISKENDKRLAELEKENENVH